MANLTFGVPRRALQALLLSLACTLALPGVAASGPPSSNVAWLTAAADADVDRAFALARTQKKPVLLYWGATWCPPCNQLKATLFNRQDFATQSRSFVAVHVDGDQPGAQKLGARFKVSGYPTVVLFTPGGDEITRLPGSADAPQVMAVLQAGLAGGRPIKAVLDDARSGKKALSANEWRMLAFYSWETDHAQLVPVAERASLLAELALRSPAADTDTTTRLWLQALAASDEGKGVKPDAALHDRVVAVLADPAQTRLHMDVLTEGARDIVKVLSDAESAQRARLVARYDAALARLQADTGLSRADRLGAISARVDLARLEQPRDLLQPQLPEALVREVRDTAARMDKEISDGYERQAVITSAASLLGRAGLWGDSETLLKNNLTRSHSPYYLMSQLGSNARKLGKADEALRWYGAAYDKSEGPATRLQWGAGYLNALVDLAPADTARIESTAAQLLTDAGKDKGAFYERSAVSLKRMSNKLLAWNRSGQHAEVLQRLQRQLDTLCARVDIADGQRQRCESLLQSGAKAGMSVARAVLAESRLHPAIRERVAKHHHDVVAQAQAAIDRHPVVVLGMRQNPLVKRARRALDSAGVAHEYIEHGSYFSEWRRRNALKMWAGWPTFPMVFVKGSLVGGADDLQRLIVNGELGTLLA